jgi:protein-tyrosine phosphatase
MTNKHKKNHNKNILDKGLNSPIKPIYNTVKPVYKACHHGNVIIMGMGKGILYAGGFSRGAQHKENMLLIDLTGSEYKKNVYTTSNEFNSIQMIKNDGRDYINLPIKDYDIPCMDFSFWYSFASDIKNYLLSGKDILIACDGGHGRTGTVLSILWGILNNDLHPIESLKKVYCSEIVETIEQEEYIKCMINKEVYIPVQRYNSYIEYSYKNLPEYNYGSLTDYNYPYKSLKDDCIKPDVKPLDDNFNPFDDTTYNVTECLNCHLIFSKDDLYHGYCTDCIG